MEGIVGMPGPKSPSITGLRFCYSEGVIFMGITHLKGKCAVRALEIPTDDAPKKRTRWIVPLPEEAIGEKCQCGAKKYRLKFELSGERLCVMVYKTDGGEAPKVFFLWKQTGELASEVVSLTGKDADKKCSIQ
jgi:hypothetical protein